VDSKRLRLWLVLAGCLAFTAWSLWSQRNSTPARPTVPAGAPAATSAAAPVDPGTVPAAAAPASPASPLTDEEWRAWRATIAAVDRDPFYTIPEITAMNRPPEQPAPDAPPPPPAPATYTVKLVIMKGTEGTALIDDRVVHVGDTLGDERVVQITPDAVVLAKGTSRRRLPVAGGAAPAIQLERTR
jgi:hypothetical protein